MGKLDLSAEGIMEALGLSPDEATALLDRAEQDRSKLNPEELREMQTLTVKLMVRTAGKLLDAALVKVQPCNCPECVARRAARESFPSDPYDDGGDSDK
jgi:hypothetical protein